ncbi:unnamed protein product [Symbiodinium sp. CCMP2592]|nr:unnamed protein product [Symbiodinium sp. CCMP2592]
MTRRSRRLWLGLLAAAVSLKCSMLRDTVSKAEAMVFRPWRPRDESPDSTTLPAVTTLLVGVFIGVGAFQDYPAMPQLFESVKDKAWRSSRKGRLSERCARYRSISHDAGRRFRDESHSSDPQRSKMCRQPSP